MPSGSLEQGAQQVLIGGLNGHLEFDFDLLETAIERFGGERTMASRAIDSAKKPHRDFERLSSLPIAGLASSAGKGNAIKGHDTLVDWQSQVDFDVYASGAVLPHGAARMWEAGPPVPRLRPPQRRRGPRGRWFEGELYPVDAKRVTSLAKAIRKAIAQEESTSEEAS